MKVAEQMLFTLQMRKEYHLFDRQIQITVYSTLVLCISWWLSPERFSETSQVSTKNETKQKPLQLYNKQLCRNFIEIK